MKTLKHKKTITKRSSFPYKVIGLVLYLLWVQPFGANHLYASERKINIEVNDVTLIDVLKQIEAQSDYVFFYNNADIDTKKKISINMKDANIKDVLDKILNEYSYRINNKKIIITAKRQAPVRTNKISGVVSDDSGQPIIGQRLGKRFKQGNHDQHRRKIHNRCTRQCNDSRYLLHRI